MENIFDKLSGKTFILNRIANRKNTTVEEVHKMYRDRFTPDATLLTHYKMA